ncbi:max dimerization protein 3 isoform X2 [Canis aureus]
MGKTQPLSARGFTRKAGAGIGAPRSPGSLRRAGSERWSAAPRPLPRGRGPELGGPGGGVSQGRGRPLCLLHRVSYIVTKVVQPLRSSGQHPKAHPPPPVADMEPVASNIQVLLQAAEFLERREREAEHGYASLYPHRSPGPVYRRRKRSPQASGALDSGRKPFLWTPQPPEQASQHLAPACLCLCLRTPVLKVCAQRAGETQVSRSFALTALGPGTNPLWPFLPLLSLWPARLGWHCPPDPSSHRRAQLKRCLEQLKQQMPLGADCARSTTLSLLRWARVHIQKLEEQEQQARRLKEKLRSKQQSLQRQLEWLRGLAGPGERERPRADSLDSSGLSSERSDSDQEEVEVDVESLVFGGEAELLRGFSAGQEHSYSHSSSTWL